MPYDKSIKKAAIRYLRKYFENFNFDRHGPFVHGTSSNNLESIKKSGLCPRGEERGHVWEEKLASPKDRVFLAACRDGLPGIAAMNAVRKAEETGIENAEPVFLVLKDPRKYKELLTRDTDETFMSDVVTGSFYNDDELLKNSPKKYVWVKYSEPCYHQVDRKVIDVLDVVWEKCDSKCVQDVVKFGIPEEYWGLLSFSKAIAINGCIPLSDLEVTEDGDVECAIPFEEYDETGGCTKEEYTLKGEYAESLREYLNEKRSGNLQPLKEKMLHRKELLLDYIRREKSQVLDELLATKSTLPRRP